MEWWQQLGFSSEAEAIARGESEEVFNRTRNITPDTTSDMDKETAYIKEFVGSQKVKETTSVKLYFPKLRSGSAINSKIIGHPIRKPME